MGEDSEGGGAMNDWLHAAAEVGGGVLALCLVIFAVILMGMFIEWWADR